MATDGAYASYNLVSDPGEVDLHTIEPAVHEHSDLREFLTLVRRHALLIAFVTFIVTVATFALSVRQQKQYSSETTLLYAPAATSSAALDSDPSRAIDTIVGIATSQSVLQPVAAGARTSLSTLRDAVSVSGNPSSDLLKVAVQSSSPRQASSLANRVARVLIDDRASGVRELIRARVTFLEEQLQTFAGKTDPSSVNAAADLRTQLVETKAQLATAGPDLSVLTPAAVPTSPISPHPKRDAAIALLVGLVLGIMLGLLRDRLDRRMRGVDEVESVYRAPTLGMVPFTKRRPARSELLADFSGAGILADAYRTIRTNLSLFRLNNSDTTVVVVSSAVAAEGKSAVAANLAHALAVTGKQVLVVSADLHNPTLHEYFNLGAFEAVEGSIPLLQRVTSTRPVPAQSRTAASGLVQVLANEVPLPDAVRQIPLTVRERASGGGLAVLANGSTFFDPAALFSSGQMQRFLQQARHHYNVVVLDTPPLLVNADAALLAQSADVLVMVARLNHLTRNQARRAVRVMSASRIFPTGVIVTGDFDEASYGYGYRYGAAAGAEPEPPTEVSDQVHPARTRV